MITAYKDSIYYGNTRYVEMYNEYLGDMLSALYNMIKNESDVIECNSILYNFKKRLSELRFERYVFELTNNTINKDIIYKSNLDDYNYLFYYGEYISDNEIRIVDYFNKISEDKIIDMSKTIVDGFKRGYENGDLDLSTKKSIIVYYPLGFEKMAKTVCELMKEDVYVVLKLSNDLSPNKQLDFFHKNDYCLYYDEYLKNLDIKNMEKYLEKNREELSLYGGPLWIETFGEKDFNPEAKFLVNVNKEKIELKKDFNKKFNQLVRDYTKAGERSFSIISYPCPDIGPDFEKIFDETIKINTLDNDKYIRIHQNIIDALDKGKCVRVIGRGINKTNITINLHELENSNKETNFENCTADVNIPVGEVFTSPVLKGTNGILNVSEVFLNGLKYKNLTIEVEDGMIKSYNCDNFDSDKNNKEFIKENIFHNFDSIPVGEFAIGTNTCAYVMARKFNIQGKLDILIAEKTGPHFAFGDTCYSYSEDARIFNTDGKEIVAKDNEVSLKRKTDIDNAYFGCHTDVTIPFDELKIIEVITKDNESISIIEDGLFVLPGTEELNLEEMK